jgi:hypothetical protein
VVGAACAETGEGSARAVVSFRAACRAACAPSLFVAFGEALVSCASQRVTDKSAKVTCFMSAAAIVTPINTPPTMAAIVPKTRSFDLEGFDLESFDLESFDLEGRCIDAAASTSWSVRWTRSGLETGPDLEKGASALGLILSSKGAIALNSSSLKLSNS